MEGQIDWPETRNLCLTWGGGDNKRPTVHRLIQRGTVVGEGVSAGVGGWGGGGQV